MLCDRPWAQMAKPHASCVGIRQRQLGVCFTSVLRRVYQIPRWAVSAQNGQDSVCASNELLGREAFSKL